MESTAQYEVPGEWHGQEVGSKELSINHGMYPYLEQMEKEEWKEEQKVGIKQKYQTDHKICWTPDSLNILLYGNIVNFRQLGYPGLKLEFCCFINYV